MMVQREPDPPRVLNAVSGDRYADWEAVYQDNVTWVYRTIFARVGNMADAEDLPDSSSEAAGWRPMPVTIGVLEAVRDAGGGVRWRRWRRSRR